jgi:ATP-dependent DNA ligase
MRNYKGMGDEKLRRSIRELEQGVGEAVEKATSIPDDLRRAREVAAERGLRLEGSTGLPAVDALRDGTAPRQGATDLIAAAQAVCKPMLATAGEIPEGDGWIMEPKLDGWRWVAHRQLGGVVSYAGRNASTDYATPQHVADALMEGFPADTVVDGELIYGRTSSDVSTALSHYPERVKYVVFDVLRWAGEDVRSKPLHERKARLGLTPFSTFDLELAVCVLPHVDASEETHERFVDQGFEGTVSKLLDSKYVSGKRVKFWIKLKVVATADAVITGVVDGKGESNKGLPGAFTLLLPNGKATTIAVPDDATVAAVAADPDAFIGRVVEFKHNGPTDDGVYRHPRWLRLRDDHDAAGLGLADWRHHAKATA